MRQLINSVSLVAWRGPRVTQRRRLTTMAFRGSITRRLISLSTLRSGGYPLATQDSLPAAGPALPDGIGYPQDSQRKVSSLWLFSFPELLGAMGGPFREAAPPRTTWAKSASRVYSALQSKWPLRPPSAL